MDKPEETSLATQETSKLPVRIAPAFDRFWAPLFLRPITDVASRITPYLPGIRNPLSFLAGLMACGFRLPWMSDSYTILARFLVAFAGSAHLGAFLNDCILARLFHPKNGFEMLESAEHLREKAGLCQSLAQTTLGPLKIEIAQMKSEHEAEELLVKNGKMSPEVKLEEEVALAKHKELLENAGNIIKNHEEAVATALADAESIYRKVKRHGNKWKAGIADTSAVEARATEKVHDLARRITALHERTGSVLKAAQDEIGKFDKKMHENS